MKWCILDFACECLKEKVREKDIERECVYVIMCDRVCVVCLCVYVCVCVCVCVINREWQEMYLFINLLDYGNLYLLLE